MDLDIKTFKDDLWSGRLKRRDVAKALAGFGVTMAVLPVGGRAARADADGQPTMYTWSGYEVPEFWPAYEEKYGELPNFTFFADEEEALAKMQAGFRPDILFPCSYKVQKWYDAGFLGPIDTSRLSHWKDVFPALKSMDGVTINGETVFIPMDWGQTSVLFRTDLAPEYIDNPTWNIMWDPKYEGRLSMIDSLIDGVAVAGIVLGLENPFDIQGEDVERVRAKLKEQLPLLRFYSTDMTSVEQALASGELVAAVTWNSSFATLRREGVPVAYMNPKEKAMTWVCGLCMVRGTEYPDKSHEAIDAFLDPRSRAFDTTEFGYGGSTSAGFELIDDATLAELGLPRDPAELLASGIFQIPMTNEPELQTMFEEVKAGV
ncbi:MAG: ABC transporter substrate-binding protein [Alphaproteobacteria bacterium]